MHRHERPQIPNVRWVSHSNLHKSEKFFTKPVPPLDPSTSNLQDLKISSPNDKPRASTHLQRHRRQFHAPPYPATRLHVPHVPSNAMTSWMTSLWCHHTLQSNPFVQTDPVWRIYPDSVWTTCKKKKKKKKLWPSWTLTLTKKWKFSKMACSTQFFEYISILRSVSSFEARTFCKLSNS